MSDEGTEALADKLNIDVLPTVQFYRRGRLVWQVAGTQTIDGGSALSEGVLFYGNAMADGASSTDYVPDISNAAQLQDFVNGHGSNDSGGENALRVLDVSLSDGTGCIKVFPAVVALAKSFQGYASFARLLGDASPETERLLGQLNVVQVPTFIFFRGGREVGRHVGSSRGDLIGHILQIQVRHVHAHETCMCTCAAMTVHSSC